MSGHYVVISADCHAGPESPAYREHLDPEFRDDFDEELASRQQLLDRVRFEGDEQFKEE